MDWHVFITVLLLAATGLDFSLAQGDLNSTTIKPISTMNTRTTATTTKSEPSTTTPTTTMPSSTVQVSETTAINETSTESPGATMTSPVAETTLHQSNGSDTFSSNSTTDSSASESSQTTESPTSTPVLATNPSASTSSTDAATTTITPKSTVSETTTVEQTGTTLPSTTSLTSTLSTTTDASITDTTSQPQTTTGAATPSSKSSTGITAKPSTTATITSTTPAPGKALDVKIGETNILLATPEDGPLPLFVELSGTANESLDGLWLVIRDAAKNTSEDHLLKLSLSGSSLSDEGRYVVNQSDQVDLANKLKDVESVLIAFYTDEDSADQLSTNATTLMDALLYSSNGMIDPGLSEMFSNISPYSLVINHQPLQGIGDISLSRCIHNQFGTAFVLTAATLNEENNCVLNTSHQLQMKLRREKQSCADLTPGFNNSLADKVITEVNENKQCGLSRFMFQDSIVIKSHCVSNTEELEVRFTINSAFQEQLDLVVDGINQFVESKPQVKLQSETFTVLNCSSHCFPKHTAPKKSDDDKIHVTVAVVVSCIGIFLIVLLIVVIYMRRKKRGILQFRMTRLDEDDDDLMGDMDDFVGNQGPTFRSFK